MSKVEFVHVGPIQRAVVSEQVAHRLLSLIQSGNLKPGQQLPPERELAVTLEVSRPSLREALRALSLLGVVRIRPGGGAFVSALDPQVLLAPIHFLVSLDSANLDSLFDARILIEPEITRLAASRITKAALETLKSCVEQEADDLRDVDRFIASDELFHKTIFAAVDNPFLIKIATSLHILGHASRNVTGHVPGVVEQSLADHRRIVAALASRSGAKAAAAMEAHLRNVRDAYHKRSARGARRSRVR